MPRAPRLNKEGKQAGIGFFLHSCFPYFDACWCFWRLGGELIFGRESDFLERKNCASGLTFAGASETFSAHAFLEFNRKGGAQKISWQKKTIIY
jgi:hypothetical protein